MTQFLCPSMNEAAEDDCCLDEVMCIGKLTSDVNSGTDAFFIFSMSP